MADAQAALAAVEPNQEVVQEGEVSQEGVQEGEASVVPQAEGQPAATDAQVENVVQKIKQLKLKVDGTEIIENLPFEVTEEQAEYLKKELQMSKMSQKRAQEAAELRKSSQKRESELNQFLDLLKEKPELILQQLGKNPVELAEKWLQEEVEKMQMDPKERRIKELEAEMKKISDEKMSAKKAQEEAQAKAIRDKYAADYEKELLDAMQKGNIPNEPHLIAKMVDYMAIAMKQNIDVSFADIIPLVQDSQKNTVKNALKGMKADDLIQLLSEQAINDLVVKKMPKADKKKAPPTAQQIKDAGEQKEENGKLKFRKESASDFFRKLTLENAGKE